MHGSIASKMPHCPTILILEILIKNRHPLNFRAGE
ncbi:protein of unknown function [Burkholderia multivorans]